MLSGFVCVRHRSAYRRLAPGPRFSFAVIGPNCIPLLCHTGAAAAIQGNIATLDSAAEFRLQVKIPGKYLQWPCPIGMRISAKLCQVNLQKHMDGAEDFGNRTLGTNTHKA